MQLVKANRDALLKPLQVVSGIVERRQTLPILANILVRKDGERVSFTATDLELQIQTSAPIGAGNDVAATTVAARKLVDILRALPEAYRETLIMRLVEGMTGPEIAERTGLTPESVRVNLHRGMKLLRAELGAPDAGGEAP